MALYVTFDPATDDISDLPGRVIKMFEESFYHEYQIPDFTREITRAKPEDYISIINQYDITVVRKIADAMRVVEIKRQVKELNEEIKHGSDAWEEGTDECSMAECDPSDQYCKSMEIEELAKELNTLVVKS